MIEMLQTKYATSYVIYLTIALVMSYLAGSLPTAYLFGKRLKGIDIREHGSGNVGASNTFRVLGKGPGICVLVVDILKGVLATTIIGDFFMYFFDDVLSRVLLGVAVVVGHNWTIFLNFKGGKGIATSLGVLIGLSVKFPYLGSVLLISIFAWLIVFLASGYVSLASIFASIVLPISMIVTVQPAELIVLGSVFCVFVVVRHRPNICKLMRGKESKVPLSYLSKKIKKPSE